jgi:C_GCAxxG_C_C family probable redox protein
VKTTMMPKEEFVKKAGDLAAYNEMLYAGCGQALVAAFQELLGMRNIPALKAATGFSGGIANQGLPCGPLLGGIMIIGMKYGRDNLEDYSLSRRIKEPILRLCKEFRKEFGSLNCRDIIGLDLSDPEQLRQFADKDIRNKLCASVVIRKTAEIVAAILDDMEQEMLLSAAAIGKTATKKEC